MSAATDGLPRLADVIRTHGIAAKKSLGQNFILDFNLTSRIARLAAPLAGRTIVEVGPGPGGLTRALLAEGAARVVAVERDDRCLSALAQVAEAYPGRLTVHPADALSADWPALLRDVPKPAAIVANLPYGIATKLLVGWLEAEPWPPWFDLMVLMFQKEVAERIVAAPGSKAYGRLAVIAQWRCEADITMSLPPEAFTPPPKVSSAVVTFRPRATPDAGLLRKGVGSCHGRRFRPAPQDAAPEPEIAHRHARIIAARSRPRSRTARRAPHGRRVRHPPPRLSRPRGCSGPHPSGISHSAASRHRVTPGTRALHRRRSAR